MFFSRLFPKDSNEAIDFQGERTLEALSKFVDTNGQEAGRLAEETAEQVEEADEELPTEHEDL